MQIVLTKSTKAVEVVLIINEETHGVMCVKIT